MVLCLELVLMLLYNMMAHRIASTLLWPLLSSVAWLPMLVLVCVSIYGTTYVVAGTILSKPLLNTYQKSFVTQLYRKT
jgi:hypothetical protein